MADPPAGPTHFPDGLIWQASQHLLLRAEGACLPKADKCNMLSQIIIKIGERSANGC